MTSIRSVLNSTNQPLQPSRVFIGQFDPVLQYSTALVSISTDTNCTLTITQSDDRITQISHTFSVLANVPYSQIVQLDYPYFKLSLLNTSESTQTFLTLTAIYREVSVSIPPSGLANPLPVSVSNTVGVNVLNDITHSVPISGSVSVSNFPSSQGITGSVNISDSAGNPTVSSSGKFQVQDIDAETSLASLVAGLSSTFNVDVVNFPSSQPISGGVNISDSAGLPITTVTGILQVADTVAQGSLSSIVTGLSNPLVVNIHASNNNIIASTSGSVNSCLYDTAGSALNITSGALHTVIDNPSVVISGSAGSVISAQNNCMNVGLFDSTGTALTLTSGSLNVQTQSGLALDSSIQTLISQTTDNGGFFWQSETVNNNDLSHIVNLTQKNAIIYSYFGNVVPDDPTDAIVLTPFYSADGTTFYQSDVSFSPFTMATSDFCSSQICGAGYVKLKITGLTSFCVISAYLNHV